MVFRRFVGIFAQPSHPLALFLDDLQWLDAATLDLVEDLLTQPDVHHLMLIGAYRDNEVDSSHPLMRKLEAIRYRGSCRSRDQLAPLDQQYVTQLLVDALHTEPKRAAPPGATGSREDSRQSVFRDSVSSRARRRESARVRS